MEGHRIDRRLMKDATDFQERYLIFDYHNASHVLDALSSGMMYGRMKGIGEQEEKLLHTSLLLHEIGMIYGREGHEEMSALICEFVLPHYGGTRQKGLRLAFAFEKPAFQSQIPYGLCQKVEIRGAEGKSACAGRHD